MPRRTLLRTPPNEPERRCILTGARGARDELIRLALGPDGDLLPDLGAKAPGRGAWLVADSAVIAEAEAKGRLRGAAARAFKSNGIRLPDDLAGTIRAGLERRALDRLGLEMRAGHLVLGSDRIADALTAGSVRLLLHAADAAPDGISKLVVKLRGTGVSLVLPTGRTELSLALGRENVVHAALRDRAAAERVSVAVARWRAFCGLGDGETAAGETPADAE